METKRGSIINVKFSSEEKKRLERLADEKGIGASVWIRMITIERLTLIDKENTLEEQKQLAMEKKKEIAEKKLKIMESKIARTFKVKCEGCNAMVMPPAKICKNCGEFRQWQKQAEQHAAKEAEEANVNICKWCNQHFRPETEDQICCSGVCLSRCDDAGILPVDNSANT